MNIYLKIKKLYLFQYINLKCFSLFNRKIENDKHIVIFDTSINSDNLGDEIINDYCNKIFNEIKLCKVDRVPTHTYPDNYEEKFLSKTSLKIITGTNLLSPKINEIGWHRPTKLNMQTNLVLLGVGWCGYSNSSNGFTRLFYNTMLMKDALHSVRDSYTESKLRELGLTNIVNTACPTMWRLTPELCKLIPVKKANRVITTITDYSQDQENDWYMLDTLLKYYDKVYVWLQGKYDLEYLYKYPKFKNLICVNKCLSCYDSILKDEDLDYIGTRLHAGIRALNMQKRSFIVAIDNRALEIAKDTNLPIIERNSLKKDLRKMIVNDYITDIHIPIDSINMWKDQFKNKISVGK